MSKKPNEKNAEKYIKYINRYIDNRIIITEQQGRTTQKETDRQTVCDRQTDRLSVTDRQTDRLSVKDRQTDCL